MADILGGYEPSKKYGGAGQQSQRPRTFSELQKEGVARPGPSQVFQASSAQRSATDTTPPAGSGPGYQHTYTGERPWWADKTAKDFAGWATQHDKTDGSGKYWNPAEGNQDKLGNGFYIGGEGADPTFSGYVPGIGSVPIGTEAGWFDKWYNNWKTSSDEQSKRQEELAKQRFAATSRQKAPAAQNSQSLWQSIMGYYPNLPQEYGWQNGWGGYSSGMQNWMNQYMPQQGSRTPSAGIDSPFLNAADAGGISKSVSDPNTPESWYQLNPAMRRMSAQSSYEMPGAEGGFGTGVYNPTGEGPYGPGESPGVGGGQTPGTGTPPPANTPPATPPVTPPATPPPQYTPPQTPPYNPGQTGMDRRATSWGDGFTPFQPNQSPLSAQLMQQLMGYMQNPNAYNSDLVVGSYNRLNSLLTEQGDVERQRIGEEMARRGIGDSTIHGGRLGDVAIEQSRARSDLAHQLLSDAAQQQSGSMAQALGLGMGYDQNQFGNQLAAWQANESGERGRFQDTMSYDNQRFMQWLQQFYANNTQNSDYWDFILRQLGL